MPVPDAAAAGGKGVTSTGRPKGRPRKEPSKSKTVPIIHKIMASVNNHPGQPILYASTTKGTVKLVVDGHHFRYTFRKGKFTIFQCCYKEGKEECLMRVVTDQKRVYPLDGEHVHFIQATDKSVTSVQFAPGEVTEEPDDQQFIIDNAMNNPEVSGEIKHEDMAFSISAGGKNASTVDIKLEGNSSQESVLVNAESTQVGSIVTLPASTVSNEEPNEFREKIKKRLQRALLGKKK